MDIADQLAEHVFGAGAPCDSLVGSGTFPLGWSAEYLRLLAIANGEWSHRSMWPRQLVAAVHFASWYLPLRYEVWSTREEKQNTDTERELNSLRSPSEMFLMRGSTPTENSERA